MTNVIDSKSAVMGDGNAYERSSVPEENSVKIIPDVTVRTSGRDGM
jgi:hypothetical protein